MHSVHSHSAELTPEQLATAARAAGLDFIATTEHNTAEAHGSWGPHAGDDLLVILVLDEWARALTVDVHCACRRPAIGNSESPPARPELPGQS